LGKGKAFSGNPEFNAKLDKVGSYSGWAKNALTWTVREGTEYKSILSPVDDVAKVGLFACHLSSAFNQDSPLLDEYEALLPFNYAPTKSYMPGSGVFISADTEYPDECFRLL